MANIAGMEVALPSFSLTGLFSSTWIYVAIVGFIGLILIALVAVLLFYRTYNRKVVVFENVSGRGYQRVLTTRARIVKLGISGEEVLKTFVGGYYVSAYGRKMDKNTYWFAKGSDGYWYNIILGDLDTKLALLDIEPIDRDVRMFHIAIDRLNHSNYDKKSFMEKYGGWIAIFILMIIMVGGFWVISGQIAKSNEQLAQASVQLANALKSNAASTAVTGLSPA